MPNASKQKRIVIPADQGPSRGSGRRNFLPKQPHGDLLDDELRDVLGMLEEALDEGTPTRRARAITSEAHKLLLSILGQKRKA